MNLADLATSLGFGNCGNVWGECSAVFQSLFYFFSPPAKRNNPAVALAQADRQGNLLQAAFSPLRPLRPRRVGFKSLCGLTAARRTVYCTLTYIKPLERLDGPCGENPRFHHCMEARPQYVIKSSTSRELCDDLSSFSAFTRASLRA